jgi:hypothetical protein
MANSDNFDAPPNKLSLKHAAFSPPQLCAPIGEILHSPLSVGVSF